MDIARESQWKPNISANNVINVKLLFLYLLETHDVDYIKAWYDGWIQAYRKDVRTPLGPPWVHVHLNRCMVGFLCIMLFVYNESTITLCKNIVGITCP